MAGTIKNHSDKGDDVYAIIMSNGEKIGDSNKRKDEAKKSAQILGIRELFFLGLEDTKIQCNHEVIEKIERIIISKKIFRMYTHSNKDTHQDHFNTSRISLAAGRNVSQILFYESPSSDLDFRPTFFTDIEKTLDKKLNSLKVYKSLSKLKKRYLEINAIINSASFRGYQSKTKFAESFEVYRFLEK
jgi:LmbE family N-acetylglucosaminyl deacetylase